MLAGLEASRGEAVVVMDGDLQHPPRMLAEMYEEEAESHMADFTQVLSFLVLMGAVCLIAAVFIGTFLPIFLMGPKMMNGQGL